LIKFNRVNGFVETISGVFACCQLADALELEESNVEDQLLIDDRVSASFLVKIFNSFL